RDMIAEATLVVPCFGYRATMLPIFGAHGERLALSAEAGGVAVGEDSRLLLSDGRSVPNLFGLGLGTGYRLPASLGGQPNFDGQANRLWLYQNDIGAVILRGIHQVARQPGAVPPLRRTIVAERTARVRKVTT